LQDFAGFRVLICAGLGEYVLGSVGVPTIKEFERFGAVGCDWE
jgi:hypothetical protein